MQAGEEPNKIGKRYICAVCGSEFIVTKASAQQVRPLSCDGQIMQLKS
jgi:hypothetical protein